MCAGPPPADLQGIARSRAWSTGYLVATLSTWLDALGEVAEVDIDDPEQRFSFMLQLRVFGLQD